MTHRFSVLITGCLPLSQQPSALLKLQDLLSASSTLFQEQGLCLVHPHPTTEPGLENEDARGQESTIKNVSALAA